MDPVSMAMMGVQTAMGLGQMVKGLTMDNPNLPKYEKSEAVRSYLGTARNELGGLSPQAAEAFAQTRQAGAEMYGSAQRAASSGGQALRAAMAVGGSVGKGVAAVAMQEAANRNQRMSVLGQATQMQAGEDRAKQAQDFAIAEEARARRDAMIGAGMQNMAGAANSALNYGMAKQQGDVLKSIYGAGDAASKTESLANSGATMAKISGLVGAGGAAANLFGQPQAAPDLSHLGPVAVPQAGPATMGPPAPAAQPTPQVLAPAYPYVTSNRIATMPGLIQPYKLGPQPYEQAMQLGQSFFNSF